MFAFNKDLKFHFRSSRGECLGMSALQFVHLFIHSFIHCSESLSGSCPTTHPHINTLYLSSTLPALGTVYPVNEVMQIFKSD